MVKDRLDDVYFDWMYDLVCDERLSYRDLLYLLYDTDFTYTIPLDGNREDDGINLRYRFGRENGYDEAIVAHYLDNRPCSVLEMMVALSLRCEEHIMSDPYEGNRTSQWFQTMLISLGLGHMTDGHYDRAYACMVIQRFLNREYDQTGKGGLFTVYGRQEDMRNVEIWYQMNWYLNEVYGVN